MRSLISQLRHVIRVLLKAPGFTITAILILGFGIGANTAIFSLINTVLLRPLPYRHPERLVDISLSYQNGRIALDHPDFLDIAAAQTCFDCIAVGHDDPLDLTGSGEAQRLWVNFCSPSQFTLTGRTAILGRVFNNQEDVPDGPLLAVISERFWRNHFNSDPNVIGKKLRLSEQSFEIIGVVPIQLDMWGNPPTDVYLPANSVALFSYPLAQRDFHIFGCCGRLKVGVSIEQAQAELETIHQGLIDRYPDTDKGYGIHVTPLFENVVRGYSGTVWLLGAAVALLLLIAAANVANLLFVRGLERRRELAIRAAIGATRSRLIGQMLLETGILSFLGGIAGLGLALGGIEMIKKLSPPEIYRLQEVRLDLPALLFVVGAIVLVAFISGVAPAFSLSKPKLGSVLKEEGGRTGTGSLQKYRVQTMLVAGQVALACILMIGAGLLVRSFEAAQGVSLGFNPHQILTAEIFLTGSTYETNEAKTKAFWDAVLGKVRQLPGVTGVAISSRPPLYYDWESYAQFTIEGQPDPGLGRRPLLDSQLISPDYFRTLEILLLNGREFNLEDRLDGQPVVIIDDGIAQHYFSGQNPIGKTINYTSDRVRHCTIVGVAPHVRYRTPGTEESQFQVYFPYSQNDSALEILLIRCQGDPNAQTAAVRKAVQSIDPNVPLPNIKTYDDLFAQKLATRKLASTLVSLFSGAALCLSAIGLYGVLAYSVSQRRREIGVRIALGAESLKIVQLVTQQGFKLIGIGLVAGTVVALVCTRFIESMLYGVTAIDPISLVTAILVLCFAGFLACLVPALRAARINPITALRE